VSLTIQEFPCVSVQSPAPREVTQPLHSFRTKVEKMGCGANKAPRLAQHPTWKLRQEIPESPSGRVGEGDALRYGHIFKTPSSTTVFTPLSPPFIMKQV
jgi:hypothetical protein